MPPVPRIVRKRLYLQIYLAFVGVALLCVIVAAVTARTLGGRPHEERMAWTSVAQLVVDALPPAGSSPDAVGAALERLHERHGPALILWSADGTLVAAAGIPAPGSLDPSGSGGWFRTDAGPGVRMKVEDGRWIGAVLTDRKGGENLPGHLLVLLALALAVGVGCYPIARRITRRLELLESAVTAWGEGSLSARVPVRGKDEVARLARRFNEAAERIGALVEAQERMLAGASHELRSPLARLRMAFELVGGAGSEETKAKYLAGIERDIDELDELVGDLLLSSRLRAGAERPPRRPSISWPSPETWPSAMALRSTATASSSTATRASCEGSCATFSRTPSATAAARSKSR